MSSSIGVFAMCCFLAVQAMPSGYGSSGGGGGGGGGHSDIKLTAIPDLSGFSKLTYPNFELQDLGTHSHGHLPAKEVKVVRTIKITVPQPFPVNVPHKVPYPVHVAKPYPVEVTKLVPHPVAVPVEVIKNVPVPVEVPKPYPVPQHEYNERHIGGNDGGHEVQQGHGWNGGQESQQAHGWNGGQESQQVNDWQPLGNQQQHNFEQQSYGGHEGGEGHADQSGAYAAVIASHQQNYGEQQVEDQQHQHQ